MAEPSLQGGSGIGELGLTVKPGPDDRMLIALGLRGHTGVREGVTGSLGMKYEFSSAYMSRGNGSFLPLGRGLLAFLSPRRQFGRRSDAIHVFFVFFLDLRTRLVYIS